VKKITKALHFGYQKDLQKTMAVPIYQTTAYEFKNLQHAGNLFDLKEIGNIYTRLTNPTTEILEKRFNSLEGGVGALVTASGMSAIFYAVANLAESGDNIIFSSKIYGGSTTLFTHTLKRFGIVAKAFDIDNPKEIKKLIDKKTKAIFFETISNPSIDIADIEKIVKIADKKGIITIADNTVATPFLCQPIKKGVDVVVHSATKYIGGQGLAIGGIMVEAKKVKSKLLNNPRYDHFNKPDESYHGLIYTKFDLPPFILRARLSLLRDFGATISPFNSWLLIQGVETLGIRIKQHSKNGLKVAKFLENCDSIKKVNYPLLKSYKNYKLAKKTFKNGASGLLSFEVESYKKAVEIVEKVKIFSLVANIGDSKSIITHPASTTHQQLSAVELKKAGIDKGLIRLSIGLENSNDLIKDLKQALT